jgi:hypothetical protein
MHEHLAFFHKRASCRYTFHFRPQSYTVRYRKRLLNQLNTNLLGKEAMELYFGGSHHPYFILTYKHKVTSTFGTVGKKTLLQFLKRYRGQTSGFHS